MFSQHSARHGIFPIAFATAALATITSAFATPPPKSGAAQTPRETISLVNWQFAEETSAPIAGTQLAVPANAKWTAVKVPHIFRQSGLPDESAGWYRIAIHPVAAERAKSFYLVLEGAASVKDVLVNGRPIGQHKGAYSRAVFDLSPALNFGRDNLIAVRVSNRKDEAQDCFSRSTLYYVNGGMFRPAWLVKSGSVHIYPDMGSIGVYLTPKNITPGSADLENQAVIKNNLPKPVIAKVRFVVNDPKGNFCAEAVKEEQIPAHATVPVDAVAKISNPVLWGLGHPNLYSVTVTVVIDGKISDELIEHTGFRTIEWKDHQFFLNGKVVQFRGACKHSQNEVAWNVVSDEETRWEWQMMADMGANAARLAHYPHRALEYDIADQLGMAVWAENGYAGEIWNGPGNEEKRVTPDGERLTREMVRQNWNHPSILFWSAGNETIVDVVSHYASVIHDEDKDGLRLVTYAANAKEPKNCDFVARNTYHGWYWGQFSEFSHLPENALISETGCGDWLTHHVPYGSFQWKVDQFEPEEYAGIFTEYRLQTICRNEVANRPMFFWWNFREFYNLKFKQNRNTKGLLTLAGAPKDLYFLFQSFFNPSKPVLHLCGRDFFLRSFAPDNGIKVYSNSSEVELTVNGTALEKLKNGSYRLPDSEIKTKTGSQTAVPGIAVENVFFWKAALKPGRNEIEVTDEKGLKDRMIVYQKPTDGVWPTDPHSVIQGLQSSNPENPATFIDRPIAAQSSFYTEVDGSSDNTFDQLPKGIEGASWIATRRLSDPKSKTDLSFSINPNSKGAKISVLFSTGAYPVVTLKKTDPAIAKAAGSLRQKLKVAGFRPIKGELFWRDHNLVRANAELWQRDSRPGEKLNIPGEVLDYVILAAEAN